MEDTFRAPYPPIDPYDKGFLQVSDIHKLYYEQSGNPEGLPAIVLHGGPGGGSQAPYRQFFDPKRYRIIQFDQRGAGKSQPSACLEENTTWHLVEDIEKLREHLKVEKWVVFGGSWGSTLSLAYGQTHPSRCLAFVLRGIFTLRRTELIWFYQNGASHVFPDAWEDYISPIPEAERGDIIFAYYRRLTGTDEKEKLACARAWSRWEMATSKLFMDPKLLERAENDEFCMAFARVECHYFVNAGFFKKQGQLLEDAEKLRSIPGTIVQGRYDMVCPATTAWELHRRWPEADFHLVPAAGHSCGEPGIRTKLLDATDKYAKQFGSL